MYADNLLFTVLKAIDDKSRITPKSYPILVSQAGLVVAGFDAEDVASAMAFLRDDLKCIKIAEWPTRKHPARLDAFLTAIGKVVQSELTPRDNYKVSLMPKFPSIYESYKQKHKQGAVVINDTGRPNKRMAVFGFANYSTPEVTVDSQAYHLASMRNGNAFNIVEYCLRLHPNKMVTLEKLKASLKLGGVSNINSALQKSPFDKNNGVLRMFVASSPKAIMVSSSASLDDHQLKVLEQVSKTLE